MAEGRVCLHFYEALGLAALPLGAFSVMLKRYIAGRFTTQNGKQREREQ